ncbi:MAG: hypothetical protein EBS19_12275 [Spirochaetia bacterium]|nr:hypothetical protein [Spirochaetia bacterium]
MKIYFLSLLLTCSILSQANKQISLPFPSENLLPYRENKDSEVEVILPSNQSSLPNQTDTSQAPKKKKEEKPADPSFGILPKAMYNLNRNDLDKATADLNQATASEGESANKAKIEVVRLLAKERKITQAKSIIDGIENVDIKYKAFFELAAGIENVSNKKSEREESIPFYLQIITEAPRESTVEKKGKEKGKDDSPDFNPLIPRSRWALANILYKGGEFSAALDHLSRIIIDYPKSEFLDDARSTQYADAKVKILSESSRRLFCTVQTNVDDKSKKVGARNAFSWRFVSPRF